MEAQGTIGRQSAIEIPDLKSILAVMRMSKPTRSKIIRAAIGSLLTVFFGWQILFYISTWRTERFHITQLRLVAFRNMLDTYFMDHDETWPPLAIPDLLKALSAPEYDERREFYLGTDILGRVRPWTASDGFGNDLKFTLLPDGHVRVASAGPNGVHDNGAGDDMIRVTYFPHDEANPE